MTQALVTTDINTVGVATVTLNNPDKHNVFDDRIIHQLTQAFIAIASNSSVRVMILQSNGNSFSAGADLNWMKRMADYSYEDNLQDARGLADMLHQLHNLPQPTIARIQGPAFGGAVGLVSCCDIAIASTNASFCLSEVKIGLIPATISPYVIDAIGARAAKRYFTTAERFNATTALRLGLVNEVVEPEGLDDSLNTLVNSLLSNSPAAITAAKQLIHRVAGQVITAELIESTCEDIARIRVSKEGQEGLGAFIEKRFASYNIASKH